MRSFRPGLAALLAFAVWAPWAFAMPSPLPGPAEAREAAERVSKRFYPVVQEEASRRPDPIWEFLGNLNTDFILVVLVIIVLAALVVFIVAVVRMRQARPSGPLKGEDAKAPESPAARARSVFARAREACAQGRPEEAAVLLHEAWILLLVEDGLESSAAVLTDREIARVLEERFASEAGTRLPSIKEAFSLSAALEEGLRYAGGRVEGEDIARALDEGAPAFGEAS